MSLSSMTGFGRADGGNSGWTWAVEARSVNGRNLDVRFKGPGQFEGLDRQARELCARRFGRGQLGLNIHARRDEPLSGTSINMAVLQTYLEAIEPIVAQGRARVPSADGLLALRGVIEAQETQDPPQLLAAIEQAILADIDRALEDLEQARAREGQALETVLRGLLNQISSLVQAARHEAAAQPTILNERFGRRLSELLGEAVPLDRIVQEAAVQAVKADVQEELDRLASHIGAVHDLLDKGGNCGRKLDFYMQEFMREANTLCSKSATIALSSVGLELKTLIEQLREQVQNVE